MTEPIDSDITIHKNDNRCSPALNFENGSCIPLEYLILIVEAYNNKYPNDIIKLSNTIETLNRQKYKKYLLKQLSKKLKKQCDSQQCWLEQSFINNINKEMRRRIQNNVFRPDGPNGKFTWLNTLNIDAVMKQYEDKYPEFIFLGAVPIDFDNLDGLKFSSYDFYDLEFNKNKHKIGIIFNLDRHDQPGSHWNALYADLKKGQVYFYDSYGINPTHEVRKLMRSIAKYIKSNNINPVADYNKIRHQYGNSECGVYSINFIERLLNGDSFEKICKDKTPDDVINNYRKIYFGNTNF